MGHSTNAATAAATGFGRARTGTCSRVRRDAATGWTTLTPRGGRGGARALRPVHRVAPRAWSTPPSAPRSPTTRSAARTPRSRRSPSGCAARRSDDVRRGLRTDGRGRAWGNAVVGLRNAIAPPLTIEQTRAAACGPTSTSGAAYEGPPGSVHGGVLGAGPRPDARRGGGRRRQARDDRHPHPQLPAAHRARRPARARPGSSGPRASRPGPAARSAAPTVSRSRPRGCSSCRSGRARRSPSTRGQPDARATSSRRVRGPRSASGSTLTPRSPASVSRASSSAIASSSAARLARPSRGLLGRPAATPGRPRRARAAAAPSGRRSAARSRSAPTRPRPRNETAQCRTAVTRFLKPVR